jgi:hypothetical protein
MIYSGEVSYWPIAAEGKLSASDGTAAAPSGQWLLKVCDRADDGFLCNPDISPHPIPTNTARQAAAGMGAFSPTRVTRCMMRRMLTLSNGSTACIVQRLSHMITSSGAQTWR